MNIAPTLTLNGSDPSRLRDEARAMRHALLNLPHHDLNQRDWQLHPDRWQAVTKIVEQFERARKEYATLCYEIEDAVLDYEAARDR